MNILKCDAIITSVLIELVVRPPIIEHEQGTGLLKLEDRERNARPARGGVPQGMR